MATVAVVFLVLVAAPLVIYGEHQRQASQTAASVAAQPSLRLSGIPKLVANREDEVSEISHAVAAESGPGVKKQLSMASQASAFVPRFLWPSKPFESYGEDVSVFVYNIPSMYHTSSAITQLGLLFINGGLAAVLLGALALAFLARWLLDRTGRGPITALVVILVVQVVLSNETSLVLNVAAAVRAFLVVGLAGALLALLLQATRSYRDHIVGRA
jgi:hypothetical protein